jgi:hypothetical protein
VTCPNCGGVSPDSARHCAGCGTKLPGADVPQKRRGAHWVRNSILVSVVLVAGACVALVVSRQYQEFKREIEQIENEARRRLAEVQSLPRYGKWAVESDTSPFDDSKTVVLSLSAEKPITDWLGISHTPRLILRCKEKKTEAYVVTGTQPKTEFGEYGRELGVRMRARYDKEREWEYMMGKSTDGEALFFPEAVREVKHMLGRKSLVLEFVPFQSAPVQVLFDLSSLEEAVKPLREACSW